MTGTLITVAPTGADRGKAEVPALPVTLAELVTTAKECEALGAAVVHVRTRDPQDRDGLRAVVAALRESTGLIVQLATTGAEDRLTVVDAGPDMVSIPMESPGTTINLHTRAQERGVVPEYRILGLDQLSLLERVLTRYGLPAGGHIHLGLRLGAPDGAPGTAATLVACEQAIRDLPAGTTFSATGIGRSTLPVMLASLATGGHLRVGMQDTLSYAENRPVDSNMQLVARAVGFAQLAQRPPLTPAQARDLLGVPPR
ncbi:3-keto-5-aminohexanoate cleavage protein [Actinoplanes derwentensis]|uniref:Uncharacterized conserved protein, DUF849 family n=1 Tax=Actinoplanes derwentensis TaxID=113562 RepID=A0A1H2CYY6_9ACTN|nr:3-keto-5-aminohexanoate cleavage protein [Actinoplanes derwentensis]GID86588.1 3-keto-5-aminohexanoate cleavage protein [Actinoplanes derwentensis]SDT75760.1 Uncharacterized conserved protein, DUF849 family [Actinoplanes derwentensis]